MREVEWFNAKLPNKISQLLLASIKRENYLDPNWITEAIVRATDEQTTFEFQVWRAVKDLVFFLEKK